MSKIISLAFLRPSKDSKFINRMTGKLSRHNVFHVELYFDSINQCFSIQYGEKACLRYKNLANPLYEIVSFLVSVQQYENCLQFCRNVSESNVVFDNRGMYMSLFNMGCVGQSSKELGKTFCSKIITEALQHAQIGEFMECNPSLTTPSMLMDVSLVHTRRICSSVPFKCNAMISHGVMKNVIT